MRKRSLHATGFMLLAIGLSGAQTNIQTRVLVLTGCGGYVHTNAINTLSSMLTTNAAAWNLAVTVVPTAANFTITYLRGFDIVFLDNNTTLGLVITGAQQTAYQQWMTEGGGTVGNHGALDHGNSWAWYTANMALTIFTGHSGWGADLNAQVKIDNIPTAGIIRAQKPEYASLLAFYPVSPTSWTWPDEWYSFQTNPRAQVDMLMTIDEASFVENGTMGDHPVTWTLTMPTGPTGRNGKFFYSSRGHETTAITDANAGNTNYTRNMFHFGICWAAGRTYTAASCQTPAVGVTPGKSLGANLRIGVQGSALQVYVGGSVPYTAELFTSSGRKLAQKAGMGDKICSFTNLKSSVYIVKVKSGPESFIKRVAL